MAADEHAAEDVGRSAELFAVQPDFCLDGLVVNVEAAGDGHQGGHGQGALLAFLEGDVLAVATITIQTGLDKIVAGCEFTLPRSSTTQLVVDVDVGTTGRTSDIERGLHGLQSYGQTLLAITEFNCTILRREAHGLDTIGMLPHGQSAADSAVIDLLQLSVDIDNTVGRGDSHDEVAHAIVKFLTYELWHDKDQFVSLFGLHRLDAVVLESDGEWQHVGMLDTQHLRTTAHIDPILAGLEFRLADNVTLKAGTDGGKLHLDEGTRVAVDVLAFILTGGDVHGCCCHGRYRKILCHEGHDSPAEHGKQAYTFHLEYLNNYSFCIQR